MTTKAEAIGNGVNGSNGVVECSGGVCRIVPATNGIAALKAAAAATNGVATNGSSNGVATNGSSNGVATNGSSNGVATNGTSNGVATNGTSNGVSTNGSSNGVVNDGRCADAPYRLNKVRGIFLPTYITEELVEELSQMPTYHDDLFIVTYPKSGTTWMQQIVKLVRNNGVDDSRPVTDVIPWVESHYQAVQALPSPRGIMCHANYEMMAGGVPEKSPAKYIYVARNPKDVAVSYFHHTKAFKHFQFNEGWDKFFELFMEGKVSRGSWFDHVLGWWDHKDADNILFLTYEEMKQDLRKVVERVAVFMGYSLTPQVLDSITEQSTFSSMKKNPSANYSWQNKDRKDGSVGFIRKGQIGDWVNHFSEDQLTRFDAEYYRRMAGSGLSFDFSQ